MDTEIIPTDVKITGKVAFRKFFDTEKAASILSKYDFDSGSNHLNQMKTVGMVLGDPNSKIVLKGVEEGTHNIDVNLREALNPEYCDQHEVLDFLKEMKEANIIKHYTLLFEAGDMIYPVVD